MHLDEFVEVLGGGDGEQAFAGGEQGVGAVEGEVGRRGGLEGQDVSEFLEDSFGYFYEQLGSVFSGWVVL